MSFPFSLHLSTGSLRNSPFPLIFKKAKETGFEALELFLEYPHELEEIDSQALKRLKKEYHLPIYSLHAPSYERYLKKYFLEGLPFLKKTMVQTLKLAYELEASLVVIHPFPALFRKAKTAQIFADFMLSLPARGINLTIENLPRLHPSFPCAPHCLTRWDEFLNFCSPFFSMTLDTTHALSCHQDPLSFFQHCFPVIKNIHFSDFAKGIQHLPPGEGEWDYASFLRNLKKQKYSGALTLEVYPRRSTSPSFLEESFQNMLKAL